MHKKGTKISGFLSFMPLQESLAPRPAGVYANDQFCAPRKKIAAGAGYHPINCCETFLRSRTRLSASITLKASHIATGAAAVLLPRVPISAFTEQIGSERRSAFVRPREVLMCKGGRPLRTARHELKPLSAYLECAAMAFSICALTASRLKLAPFCIGGYSIAVWATLATSFCTNWKRQNSKANQL